MSAIARDATPDVFTYDYSGNMTDRDEGGDAWDKGIDEEGRLETISDGSDTWTFTYPAQNTQGERRR